MTNLDKNKLPLWIILLMVLLEGLDIAALTVPLENAFAIQFGSSFTSREFSLIITINLFFNLICTPLGSRLIDKIGSQSVLFMSVLGCGVGSLISALSPQYEYLLIGRAISGAGIGLLLPALTIRASLGRSEKQHTLFLGLVGTMFGVAFLFGTPLSALAAKIGQWQIAYATLAGLSFLSVVLLLFFRIPKEINPKMEGRTFSFPSIFILACALAVFAFGIRNINPKTSNFLNFEVIGLLIIGLFIFVFWIFYQKKKDSQLWDQVFVKPPMKGLFFRSALTGFWESSLGFLVGCALSLINFDRPGASGIVLTPVLATMAIASPLWSLVLKRIGWQNIWIIGTAIIALGGSLIIISFWMHPFFWWGLCIFGFGLAALLGAALRRAVFDLGNPEYKGFNLGMLNTSLNIGQVIGFSLWGAVNASYGKENPTGAFIVFGIYVFIALIASLAGFFLNKRKKQAKYHF